MSTFIKTLKHSDNLEVTGNKELTQYATVGTIIGSAMQDGMCPIEAYNKTVAMNKAINEDEFAQYKQSLIHKLVWISLDATCISKSVGRTINRIKVSLGDTVKIEGKLYTIESANNDNFALTLVD